MCLFTIKQSAALITARQKKRLRFGRRTCDSAHTNTLPTMFSNFLSLTQSPWARPHDARKGAKCWSPFPSSSPLFICSYLQQFVEVFDVTFLDLLRGDLRLFEMDVLIVKCLKKERNSVMESVLTQALFEASTCFQRLQLPNHRLPEGSFVTWIGSFSPHLETLRQPLFFLLQSNAFFCKLTHWLFLYFAFNLNTLLCEVSTLLNPSTLPPCVLPLFALSRFHWNCLSAALFKATRLWDCRYKAGKTYRDSITTTVKCIHVAVKQICIKNTS